MAAYLEVWRPDGAAMVPLHRQKVTVGRAASNDIAIPSDDRASRLHAVLEQYAAGWCVRDLGSRNGTFVNGDRLNGERPLHHGDEVRIGSTRLVYRASGSGDSESDTKSADPPPELTRREREVLLALFRPALSSEVFTEPASTRDIAAALFVSEAAVKQHLLRLYDKFGIHGEGERRRVRLANEAVRRGAISLAELRTQHGKAGPPP